MNTRPAVRGVLVALLLIWVAACATTDPRLAAQRVVAVSFEVVDGFLKWEAETPDLPAEVRDWADLLREEYPPLHREALRLLRVWRLLDQRPAEWPAVQRALEEMTGLAQSLHTKP